MRLEIKRGVNQNQIITGIGQLDSAVLLKALSFQEQQNSGAEKTLIIQKSDALNIEGLDQLAKDFSIQKVLSIGPLPENFMVENSSFVDVNDLINSKLFDQLQQRSILVIYEAESDLSMVSNHLIEKVHQTRLEINLDYIKHNYSFYKSLLKPRTKVMAVIKAFAYGAGSAEVARLLESVQVDYLAVAYSDEGVALRKEGISTPIMVMNPSLSDAHYLIKFDLEPEIYSIQQLAHYYNCFKTSKKKLKAHLMINTGMNRLGFDQGEIFSLISLIKESKGLSIAGISTHLAASDESSQEKFTLDQFSKFIENADLISNELGQKPLYHVLNSGGITRYPQFQFDMVRLGIGLHGIEVNHMQSSKLKAPSTLKTIISQIREIKAGETIGYGRVGVALTDMTIAVIAIGYADGYLRSFSSGKGKVMINGKLATVVGNVCMDMTMIDISRIEAQVGDEVIVFGKKPSVEMLAKWSKTISYEVLTNVSERVNRIFFIE